MAGHYCTEHETIFFMKGKMKNYAHPIGDTGEWCNEPEWGGEEIPEKVKDATPEKGTATLAIDPTRRSIERQTSLKASVEITVAKIRAGKPITSNETIAVARRFAEYLDTGEAVTEKVSDDK